MRILIHELGHQTGEQGHASLDILGGKVALFSETNTNYYQYKINNQQKLTFTVTNFEFPVKSSIVIFNWHNDVAVDLSEIIILGSECNHRSESFAALEVINGHYSINDQGSLSFEAWINVECFESFSGQAFIYKRDMSIDLDEKYKIRGVFIK